MEPIYSSNVRRSQKVFGLLKIIFDSTSMIFPETIGRVYWNHQVYNSNKNDDDKNNNDGNCFS